MTGWNLMGCIGKVRFDSPALANVVVRKRKADARRTAYHCGCCGGWHLGRETRSIHQNRKRRWLLEEDKA